MTESDHLERLRDGLRDRGVETGDDVVAAALAAIDASRPTHIPVEEAPDEELRIADERRTRLVSADGSSIATVTGGDYPRVGDLHRVVVLALRMLGELEDGETVDSFALVLALTGDDDPVRGGRLVVNSETGRGWHTAGLISQAHGLLSALARGEQ